MKKPSAVQTTTAFNPRFGQQNVLLESSGERSTVDKILDVIHAGTGALRDQPAVEVPVIGGQTGGGLDFGFGGGEQQQQNTHSDEGGGISTGTMLVGGVAVAGLTALAIRRFS